MIVSTFLVLFLLVTSNALASNVATDLSILDKSINIGKICDIVQVSKNEEAEGNSKTLLVDRFPDYHETTRVFFSVTLEGAEHLKKEMFVFSKCLILVTMDYIPMSKVIKLGKRLQFFKPVALFQDNSNNLSSLDEIENAVADITFAILFRHERGEKVYL